LQAVVGFFGELAAQLNDLCSKHVTVAATSALPLALIGVVEAGTQLGFQNSNNNGKSSGS
jgi:hypothetical protein